MGGITLVLKHIEKSDCIAFEKPEKQFLQNLNHIFELCKKKGDYACVTIEPPYKPRTTGEKSQNNLFWLIATEIAKHEGCTIQEVEEGIKERAISKGYPYHINCVTRRPQGNSMKTINTVEMSYLIDTAYEVCAELGIVLPPTMSKKSQFDDDKIGEEIINETKSTVNLASESLYDTDRMNPDDMEIFY